MGTVPFQVLFCLIWTLWKRYLQICATGYKTGGLIQILFLKSEYNNNRKYTDVGVSFIHRYKNNSIMIRGSSYESTLILRIAEVTAENGITSVVIDGATIQLIVILKNNLHTCTFG